MSVRKMCRERRGKREAMRQVNGGCERYGIEKENRYGRKGEQRKDWRCEVEEEMKEQRGSSEVNVRKKIKK